MTNPKTNFAILRTKKISSTITMRLALNHNSSGKHRKGFTTGEGGIEILAGAGEGAQAGFKRWHEMVDNAKLGRKIKGDTVRVIEFVATFSPDMKDKVNVDKWKEDTLKFFQDKYGKDKILQAVLHTDETTPHMHIMVVPLVTKEHKTKKRSVMKTTLSAKDLIGGNKGPDKLRELQDEYHAAVAHHGLERGIKGSKRKHVPLAQIVKEMNHARTQAQGLVGGKISTKDIPKVTQKRLLGIKMPDFEKAFNAIKKKYQELVKQYNKMRKELVKEKQLTKALSRNLSVAEERIGDLERILVDNGIDVVIEEKAVAEKRAENAQVWIKHTKAEAEAVKEASQREIQALKQAHGHEIEEIKVGYQGEINKIAAERDHAEQVASWWEQGYMGKDPDKMNPTIRQKMEEHARLTKQIQGTTWWDS